MSILEVNNVSKFFGGVEANVDISINVEQGSIVGLITDGDLRRLLEKKVDIYSLKASDIMNSKPKIISSNSQAISSLNIMKKNNISQLLVVDDAKKYVGIIHFHNIMKEGLNNE